LSARRCLSKAIAMARTKNQPAGVTCTAPGSSVTRPWASKGSSYSFTSTR
jgi:hypothetical protein